MTAAAASLTDRYAIKMFVKQLGGQYYTYKACLYIKIVFDVTQSAVEITHREEEKMSPRTSLKVF